MSVCGVDLGSFKTPSYIALLEENIFSFGTYIPTIEKPLPPLPPDISVLTHIAFDGPQSLPAKGNKRRECDRGARTPTNVLPGTRNELKNWRIYKQLIECGVEIFWSIYEKGLALIAGLNENDLSGIITMETYPRYIIKRLWPNEPIPSKTRAPIEYVRKFSALIKQRGYQFDEQKVVSHDYIDSMLCGMAAEHYKVKNGISAGKVGNPLLVDEEEKILREGIIYSP